MKKQKKKSIKKISRVDFLSKTSEKLEVEFEERILNTEIVTLVKELMIKKGKTFNQKKLSEKLEISEAHLSKLFSSDKKFNLNMLAKMQRIFDIRLKVLTTEMIKQLEKENTKYVFVFSSIKPTNTISISEVEGETPIKQSNFNLQFSQESRPN